MESQTTGKTTTEQQNEIVEFLRNMGVDDKKIEQWFKDPKKRSILNALSTL